MINITSPFIGISSNGAIARRYFEEGKSSFPRYVGNAFIVMLLSVFFFFVIILIFGETIHKYSQVKVSWLYVVLTIATFQFVTLILLSILQSQTKPLYYGILQISQSILNLAFSLILIYFTNLSWRGRVIGQLIAVVIIGSFSFGILIQKKLLKLQFDKSDFKDIMKFSMPLVPHTLGALLIAFTDRMLIANMIGLKETGVYTVAYQIGSVVTLLCSSFTSAYVPWLYENLNRKSDIFNIKVVKITYFFFIALILIAIGSYFTLPFIIKILVGKSFYKVSSFIFWIVLANCFNGMYYLVTVFIFYSKQTYKLAMITFILSLINIPLTYFLILNIGFQGAVYSMVIIFFLLFIFTWILSNHVYKMPWLFFLKKSKNIPVFKTPRY